MQRAKFDLPSAVRTALERLNDAGFEAYCVGGCVRDYIMGVVPHDFDITTSASPDQTSECFKDCRVIETGIKHGTVTVIVENEMLEITTFRTDGTYSDGRHPDSVTFTKSLEEDLARRDFTMNAIAYNPATGIVDPFGGREDIEKRTVRCVGEPERRFSEDALRILRALRFSSVLGFEIEKETKDAIYEKAPTLEKISNERIYAELTKLLCGQDAERILTDFRDVFALIIPPLGACFDFEHKSKYHKYDVYTHIVKTVAYCERTPVLRLAALFHDIEKPASFTVDENGVGHCYGHQERSAETAKKILRSLHADNKTIQTVENLIIWHDTHVSPDLMCIKKLISRTSFEFARLLFKLKRADILAHADDYTMTDRIDGAEKTTDLLEKENACLFVKDLKISGKDLTDMGMSGKKVGKTLEKLLNMVIEEKIPNDREILLEQANKTKP